MDNKNNKDQTIQANREKAEEVFNEIDTRLRKENPGMSEADLVHLELEEIFNHFFKKDL